MYVYNLLVACFVAGHSQRMLVGAVVTMYGLLASYGNGRVACIAETGQNGQHVPYS